MQRLVQWAYLLTVGGGLVNMWMITLELNMRMITLDTKASSVGIYILLSVWEGGHLT